MRGAALRHMSANRARASICTAAALAAVLTAACGGDARRAAVDQGLKLQIGTFVPKEHIPGLVLLLSSEPLVSVDWDGRPSFKLAESAEMSADGLTLRVKLRSDVRFHNGERVTAQGVRDLLLPMLLTTNDVADVTSIGEDRLTIRLHRAHSFKPVDLSFFTIDHPKRLDLRTGPFKVVSLEPSPVLEPFAQYHGGAPRVQRVEIKEYPTHRAAWTAMMRRDVNFLHEVSRDAIEFIDAGGDIRTYPLLRPYYVPLVFNVRHPVLQRREVRIALTEAIDRNEIVRNGMRTHGEPAEGPFWPHHWAYPRGRYPVPFNPEAAEARLDGAGLRVVRREPEMPTRFGFTCLIPAGDTRFERIALLVQRQLFAIGVNMQLQAVPVGVLLDRFLKGNFEALIYEMATGRTLNFPYRFWHSQGLLSAGYSSADEALDRMKLAATEDDLRVAVADVMRIMRADPPAVFLAMPREMRAADRSFQIEYETDADIFGTLWEMRRAGTEQARAR